MLKTFDISTPWFCSFQLEYSTPTGIRNPRIVATGADRKSAYAAIDAACAALDDAGKAQCTEYVKANTFPCVASAVFAPGPATVGIWECKMDYRVNDQARSLPVNNDTVATKAIAASFGKCAELKDPEGASTTVERDACAIAMMSQKMVCQDLNAIAPIPPPALPKRHVYRIRKH